MNDLPNSPTKQLTDKSRSCYRRRLKVLIESYECSPLRHHTAGSAWNLIIRLAKYHDLWIITESRYEKEINAYLCNNERINELVGPKGCLHFHFVARPMRRVKKRTRPVIPIQEVQQYRHWLKQAFILSRKLQCQQNYDVYHHLRGNSFFLPGHMCKNNGRFIWGPITGPTLLPWRMMQVMDRRSRLEHAIKNIIAIMSFRFSPSVRRSARKAGHVFVMTPFGQKQFYDVHGIRVEVAHEHGTDPLLHRTRSYSGNRPLQIGWAGRCIALKGLELVIRSLSDFRLKGRYVFHIAGDGPCKNKWISLARSLGIEQQCVWHGWLSESETRKMLDNCDVFVFSSLVEGTSTTVVHALSLGLPIICLDHHGYGNLVDQSCGIKILVYDMNSAIKGFSKAFSQLLSHPEQIERLSLGGIKRVHARSWDNLADRIARAYEE